MKKMMKKNKKLQGERLLYINSENYRKVPWEAQVCQYILPYYYSSFLIISQWYLTKTDMASLVVTAITGESALHILLKHHGIFLVVMDHIQYVQSFVLMQKVDTVTRLPVVMMCDIFSIGAMAFLLKPLCHNDMKHMCQFPIMKKGRSCVNPTSP